MCAIVQRCCALDSQAFRVCEGKGFELMIDTVLEIAKKHKGAPFPARELLPSATTVSTSVTNQAKALRKISVLKLKKILRTRGVCISVDGWTEDYTKTKFVQFIIHYIQDCILKEELITISEFDATKSQTAGAVRDFVFKTLADICISEEECADVTYITDAAATMITAFRVPNRTILERVSCACHMLNTCLQNSVNRKPNSQFKLSDERVPISTLIQSCKSLVTYCKQAYLSRRLSVAPVQAVETRWNSNLDMLVSIMRLYPELKDILQGRDERNRLPGPVDFLRAVVELLRPFKTATLALESSSMPTIHLVVPFFIKIRTHVSQPISEEFRYLLQYSALVAYQKQLKKVCDAKLVVDELHKAAVFLNPAMKGLLMYPTAEQSAIINGVQKMCGTTSFSFSSEHRSLPFSSVKKIAIAFRSFPFSFSFFWKMWIWFPVYRTVLCSAV
ncbi:hypothetical protein RvY_06332 [Ramazzottius varieornatus]|uniref:DUF659 domain-containing protein n=1 Tax=Ramazzottius varieornatus TaxID=947166 RepID=A0A1D1V174_RAMVA|nr:hypothetical protein RvY_06332 [Ramazzottius varieornatus]